MMKELSLHRWMEAGPERPVLLLLFAYLAGSHEIGVWMMLLALVAGAAVGLVRAVAAIPRDPKLEGPEYLTIVLVTLSIVIITFAAFGRWIALVLLVVAMAGESRRIPFPARAMPEWLLHGTRVVSNAVTLPLAGVALAGGLNSAGFALLVATIPLAMIELVRTPGEPGVELDDYTGRFAGLLIGLFGVSAGASLIAVGQATVLPLEYALLGASVGILLVAFAWFSLIDPDATRRLRRGSLLVRLAAAMLLAGEVLMMAVAPI